MFDTQKNKLMNNAITYVAPKKMVARNMSLNSGIFCVMGISIFGFNKYWWTVFLVDINMIPTSKHFLQDKTVNAEINNSYYQLYNVKIMRGFHNQEITKQKIYNNILAG